MTVRRRHPLTPRWADFGKPTHFYDWVFGVLGYTRQTDFGAAIGYRTDGHTTPQSKSPVGQGFYVSSGR